MVVKLCQYFSLEPAILRECVHLLIDNWLQNYSDPLKIPEPELHISPTGLGPQCCLSGQVV